MFKSVKYIAGAVIAAFAINASAAALVIDTFNTDQIVSDSNSSLASVSSNYVYDASNIYGGSREISVNETSQTSGNAANGVETSVGGGVLSFSSDANSSGTTTIRWDGVANGSSDLSLGLDLTGYTNFNYTIYNSDAGFEISFTLYSTDGSYSTITFTSTDAIETATSQDTPISAFLLGSGTYGAFTVENVGFDSSDLPTIGAIEATVTGGAALDFSIGSVTAVVPEPESLALVGLGLLSIAALRRRKTA